MIKIDINELQNNIEKYSLIAQEEDIQVTCQGQTVFFIQSPLFYKPDYTKLKGELNG